MVDGLEVGTGAAFGGFGGFGDGVVAAGFGAGAPDGFEPIVPEYETLPEPVTPLLPVVEDADCAVPMFDKARLTALDTEASDAVAGVEP